VLYLTERASAGAGRSTIDQIVAAVNQKHKLSKLPKPSLTLELELVIKGIRRKFEGRTKRRASPLAPDLLRQMVRAMPDGSLASKRDAALVLTGFGGALRRQELVDVDVEHIEFYDDGMKVYLPRSKTDQEGEGARVSIPFGSDKHTCPVRAMRAWLAASEVESGCVFQGVTRRGKLSGKRLDGRDVARIVQRAARRAGITLDRISGHSLRAGLGTTAAKEDKRIDVIQKHMRHKRMEQTVEYIRYAKAFDPDENAASGIGL
jgi:integrase